MYVQQWAYLGAMFDGYGRAWGLLFEVGVVMRTGQHASKSAVGILFLGGLRSGGVSPNFLRQHYGREESVGRCKITR